VRLPRLPAETQHFGVAGTLPLVARNDGVKGFNAFVLAEPGARANFNHLTPVIDWLLR